MRYSFVIPVYNRPDEVDELLESLTHQTFTDFEVVVVEDGSSIPCKHIIEKYTDRLLIHYFDKPNSGPGQTRNYGVERSTGEYVIILDSDCIIPSGYLQAVEDEFKHDPSDAFGGPDRAHDSFTPIQKAINYAMTSFFTTGGIRGGSKKKMDKFYPRSFNMGIKRDVYQNLGGFSKMRFGEDIDFSIRIFKNNYSCRLFPEAWVWHKRRTDLKKFFKQVHNSGIARINLYKKYPESLKLVHMLPAIFTVGVGLLLLLFVFSLGLIASNAYGIMTNAVIPPDMLYVGIFIGMVAIICSFAPLFLFSLLICIDSSIRNHSLWIGLLSVPASFIQLTGYGTGFLRAWWKRCILGKDEFAAFEKNFYK